MAEQVKPQLDAYERVRSQTQLNGEQALGAFLRENPVNTALDYTERQARLFGVKEDDDFNPFDNIPAGYDSYKDKFIEAKSKQEIALIKDRVDREIGNQYYAEKHPYIAMAMGMAGAVISPESALPVGVGVKGIFAAKSFGMGVKTAANVGATAAASTFTVETLLRSTQPLRSEQERNEATLFSAGLTSALSGLGAGAVKLFKNKGAEKLVEDLVDYDVSHAQPVKPMEMNLPDDFSPDFPTKFEDRADSPVPQMKELSQAIDNVEVPSRLDIYDDANYTFDLVQGATQKNIPVAEALAQESPTTKAMARLYFNDDNFTIKATPEEIDVRLRRYVEEAKKAGAKTEAAGLETPPQKIINKILQELGSDVRAPRSAYKAIDSVNQDIQDIVRLQAKQKALRSVAAIDEGQKVGLSAQAVGEVDSRLAKEKTVRLLGKLSSLFTDSKRLMSANVWGALSESPLMRRSTAMLMDNGLKYNDPIAARGGMIPAMTASEMRYKTAAVQMEDARQKMYKEFLEEAKKKGVTKDLKKTFNAEMARAFRTTESQYDSITKRVKQIRDIEDEAAINEAVQLGIIGSKEASYARAHLSRNYNRDFINKNSAAVERQLAEHFKATINDPNNPHYEFVRSGIDEIQAREQAEFLSVDDSTTYIKDKDLSLRLSNPELKKKDIASIARTITSSNMRANEGLSGLASSAEKINLSAGELSDIWFAKLAKDTVNKMMGIEDIDLQSGKLNSSAFAHFGKNRSLAISDEDLMKMGVLNDADPFASRLRNLRMMSNEIEIFRRFQTLSIEEAWKPIEKELDDMITRGERKAGLFDNSKKKLAKAGLLGSKKKKLANAGLFGDGEKLTKDDIIQHKHVFNYLWRQATDQFSYTSRAGIDETPAIFLRITNPIFGAQQLSGPERNLPELVTLGMTRSKNFARGVFEVSKKMVTSEGRANLRERKRFGMAADAALWRTQHIEPDVAVGAGAPLARTQAAAAKFGSFHRQYLDLTNPFETLMSNISAEVARFEIDDITARLAKGVRKEKDIAKLADINLTEADAMRIHAMIKKHKEEHPLFEAYNEFEWEDGVAAQKYREALYLFRELVKNKGHIDVPPMFADNPIGQLTMRYVGASSSFYQRTIMRGFQEGISTGAVATMGSIGAAMFLIASRDAADGKETTWEDALVKAIPMSGILSMAGEAANKLNYAFNTYDGKPDVAQGFAGAHYSGLSNNIMAAKGIGKMVTGNRPASGEITSIINATPLNNAIYARSAFNELEDLLRTEYGYGDKYGAPFEGRTEEERKVLADVAKAEQKKKNKALATEEEKAVKAEKKAKKAEAKQRLKEKGLIP